MAVMDEATAARAAIIIKNIKNKAYMSLQTDSIFIKAIRADEDIMSAIGSRLYGTAIALPDEQLDNVPVPYIIVTFDGMRNNAETKDFDAESDEDVSTVSVEVVAATLDALHALIADVRKSIRAFLGKADEADDDYDEYPVDYSLAATGIQYDATKPCYWQTLTYQCITNNY